MTDLCLFYARLVLSKMSRFLHLPVPVNPILPLQSTVSWVTLWK
jgi:hypothetical protein